MNNGLNLKAISIAIALALAATVSARAEGYGEANDTTSQGNGNCQLSTVNRQLQNGCQLRLPNDCWLRFNFSSDFFFVNDEYFAPEVEGYTLVGYQIRPTVTFRRHEFALIGGLQALQYGGMDKMHYVRPFFAAAWDARPWLAIRMGCLEGPASHQLHDAVQDPELQLTEKPELGLQLSVRRPHLDAELWVNWRQFIFIGDTIPERFTAGIKADFHPGKGERRLAFELPASLVFEHIGGQISNYPDTMQSLANLTLSPSLVLRGSSADSFLRRLSLSANIFGFHTMAGSDVRPFADGWALQPKVNLSAKHLLASVGFFHGHNFYAHRGNPLFWSISNYDASFYEANRNLLTFDAAFVANIGKWANFKLDFRGYHDTSASHFDYAYGMRIAVKL